MVSVLVSEGSGPGSSLGWGHCVVFLGKTIYSYGASLNLGISMGTSEFNIRGNPSKDYHPIQGGVKTYLLTSQY